MRDEDVSTSTQENSGGVSRRAVMGGALAAGGAGLLGAGPAQALARTPGQALGVGAAVPSAAGSAVSPALGGLGALSTADENRVTALIRRMTVKEKLGQLRLSGDPTTASKALSTTGLGGIFSVTGAANINRLQRQAVESTRLKIPLLVGLDVIHGYVTNFPIPLAQASSWDPAVPASDARVSATEARASGIQWTFAPMMDVTHEPRWGRIAEGCGEDP